MSDLSSPTLEDIELAGLLESIESQSRMEYPNECCGLLVEEEGRLIQIPCENLQDQMRAKYPEDFQRTAATAYFIDPKIILENQDKMRCIYHSHPDHGAYFSDEDQLIASPFGEPNFPGVSYLVISVMGGDVADRKVFTWDEGTEQFEDSASER